MHGKVPRPARRLSPFLWAAVLLAVCCCASAAVAASNAPLKKQPKPKQTLAGKWSGSYSGAFTGTFTLQWAQTGSTLHGTIKLTSPKGTYGINGSVHSGKINFGVVGAGATYTGSWSGTTMSGSYKSPHGGGSWSAHKT